MKNIKIEMKMSNHLFYDDIALDSIAKASRTAWKVC